MVAVAAILELLRIIRILDALYVLKYTSIVLFSFVTYTFQMYILEYTEMQRVLMSDMFVGSFQSPKLTFSKLLDFTADDHWNAPKRLKYNISKHAI